ncbi:MAG: hypothetical protein OEU92_04985 [Alphaproteobacteria bacterium]|nr:hypothetical protein [Alphaproteobacteria bacterium]
MTNAARPSPPLIDELKAILAGVEHARRALAQGQLVEADEFWPRLESCARRLAALDRQERDGIKPVMLALMDELQRTIMAFTTEHHQLGDRLRSTSRSMAAGTAYRQAKIR